VAVGGWPIGLRGTKNRLLHLQLIGPKVVHHLLARDRARLLAQPLEHARPLDLLLAHARHVAQQAGPLSRRRLGLLGGLDSAGHGREEWAGLRLLAHAITAARRAQRIISGSG